MEERASSSLLLKSEGREEGGRAGGLLRSFLPSSLLRCVTYMLTYYLDVRISGRWLREHRALSPESRRDQTDQRCDPYMEPLYRHDRWRCACIWQMHFVVFKSLFVFASD